MAVELNVIAKGEGGGLCVVLVTLQPLPACPVLLLKPVLVHLVLPEKWFC